VPGKDAIFGRARIGPATGTMYPPSDFDPQYDQVLKVTAANHDNGAHATLFFREGWTLEWGL
jgi:hypothetical protein